MSRPNFRAAVDFLACTSATPGLAAFDVAAQGLELGLGCRWTGVAMRTDAAGGLTLLAFRADGAAAPVMPADLPGSAVASLYDGGAADGRCWVRDDLRARFPEDPLFAGRETRFFAAEVFRDAEGAPAGHVFAMDDRDREDAADAQALLHMVSLRVAADVALWRAAEQGTPNPFHCARLIGALRAIHWKMDPALSRITFISPEAEIVLGYPCASWYADGAWTSRLNPEDRDRALALLARAQKEKNIPDFELRFIAADKREIWLRCIVSPQETAGAGIGIAGWLVDISKRKNFEVELVDNARRFRDFAEAHTDWFWEMDENLRFSFLSERFQRVTGIVPSDLLGCSQRELLAKSNAMVDEVTTKEVWETHIREIEAHQPFPGFPSPDAGHRWAVDPLVDQR